MYCAAGGRAALAGQALKERGYSEVYNLGGFGLARRGQAAMRPARAFKRLIEAIQHGLGDQPVCPQRRRHLDAGAVGECPDPVRQPTWRQEPRRDDHTSRALAAQSAESVGQ